MKKTVRIISWICAFAFIAGIAPIVLSRGAATAYTNGDTIEFGSYPQTHITDEALIASLNAAGADIEWTSYGYNVNGGTDFAFYKDVVFENVKYRAVWFTMYRFAYGYGAANDNGLQSARGYVKDTVHWFRFDPISWTVLDPEEGLLIANAILDSQAINDRYFRKENSNIYYADPAFQYLANDYAHSTVRTWLQNNFATTAFTSQETSALTPKTLTDATADMPEGCETFAYPSTEDAIFLLSYAEVLNTDYFANKSFRSRKGTDYARAQGLNNNNVSNPFDVWFLRSPGDQSGHQVHVNLQGNCLYDSVDSYGNDIGICPALYISLAAYDELVKTGQEPSEPEPGSEPVSEPTSEPEPSEPNTEPTTEPVTEPEDPNTDPYADLSFAFADGILTVSGTGAIPTVADEAEPPFAPYAEECRAIVLSDGIEAVQSSAFAGLDRIEILILNGPVTLAAGAFASNEALRTVVCSDAVQTAADAFASDAAISLYEPKAKPHTGALPAGCAVLPYFFADGTLRIEGSVEMDMYALLDLMTVMCGYFDGIHSVRFDSYTSLDLPFYVYDPARGTYVTRHSATLEGASFGVGLPDGSGWRAASFNELCALAAEHELGTFCLTVDTETEEEIKDTQMEIRAPGIQSTIQRVLKWIVGLMNFMFNLLSKLRSI